MYLPEFSIEAAETMAAFEHFVYQQSKGHIVIRNFQGKFFLIIFLDMMS